MSLPALSSFVPPGENSYLEPMLYHGNAGPAFVAGLIRDDGGRLRQQCLPVEQLPEWLRALEPNRDSYISQGEFRCRARRIATLRTMGLTFADLGDDGLLGHYGDAHAVQRILEVLDEFGIVAPSLILASGRGYHIKWLFERAVPWQALPRWDRVTRAITERLRQPLNADPKATDAARVLRVAGTRNSRTGTIARIVFLNNVGGEPLRYPFDAFTEEVLPRLRPSHHSHLGDQTRTQRTPGEGVSNHYTRSSLWWARLCDIRRLCQIRGWIAPYGGVPVGYRDTVLFLCANAVSWFSRPKTWEDEIHALGEEFTPSLRENERRTYLGTVSRRFFASLVKGAEEQRYRYSTTRLIELLEIDRQEMRSLRVLVAPDISRNRKRARDRRRDEAVRRSRGAVERGTYLATARERAEEARRLADEGLSQVAIATRLRVTQQAVSRYLCT
jgi:hypothetical protein